LPLSPLLDFWYMVILCGRALPGHFPQPSEPETPTVSEHPQRRREGNQPQCACLQTTVDAICE
jgi:hypothetical protein